MHLLSAKNTIDYLLSKLVIALLFMPFLAQAQKESAAPATAYFQQHVDHRIAVVLDDRAHVLHGEISTSYTNNSLESLDFLWIHIWPNAYANGETALARQQFRSGDMFMFWAMQRDLGGIDSLDFMIDGVTAQWDYHPEFMDIVKLTLNAPLLPGGSLEYSTPFRVKLPSGQISRLGHVGESYQVTQWYPKPAVYDRDGWHEMPYLNQGEFYSEFGSFDVSITLPSNYVVGATGDLMPQEADNAAELVFMDSLAAATARSIDLAAFNGEVVIPGTGMEDDLEGDLNDSPPSAKTTKTLRFRQDRVHDFAWFADKRWQVLKGSVELPWSGRKVTTWAMFTEAEANLWSHALEYIGDATLAYSKWNGDYPYNHVTAVDGTISAGGGMEYPNVTVIGTSGTALALESVIVHEVGHNWFYGILGSNERTNAWMDEGINSFNETRYFVEKYGEELGLAGRRSETTPLLEKLELNEFSYASRNQLAYLLSARMLVDQPMQCHSDAYSQFNYGAIVYNKTAAAFDYLQGALGTDVFDLGMQRYFEKWKFRHPGPYDLRAVLESEAGKDLSWFFDDLIGTTGHIDYSIERVRQTGDLLEVKVFNNGDIPGPFEVSGQQEDSSWVSLGWFEGIPSADATTIQVAAGVGNIPFKRICLDASERMLEYNRHNNTSRTSGLLRRIEPLAIRFLTRLDRSDRTIINYLPVVGWNAQDGWMPGLALHNSVLPLRDWEWMIMPMYSTSMNCATGIARLSYRLNNWRWEAQIRRFNVFDTPEFSYKNTTRSALRVMASFNREPTSPLSSELTMEATDLRLRRQYLGSIDDPGWAPLGETYRQALTVNWKASKQHLLVNQSLALQWKGMGSLYQYQPSPYWLGLRGDPGLFPSFDNLAHVFTLEYEGSKSIRSKGKGLHWRVFGGIVSGNQELYPLLGSGPSGAVDPMMDYIFLSRDGAGWLGRQIATQHGGLPMSNVIAKESLVAASFKWKASRLIGLFAGGVMADGDAHWASGLSVSLGPLELQLPLVSDQLLDAYEYDPAAQITWRLDIQSLSPYHLLREGKASFN